MNREIKSLPMVALRGMTIMPEMVVHFDVSREKSIAAIQEAMAGDQKIFLVAQKSIETDDPTQEDVYEVGTVGTIKQIMKLPKHIVRVLVSGETRGILKQLQQDTRSPAFGSKHGRSTDAVSDRRRHWLLLQRSVPGTDVVFP